MVRALQSTQPQLRIQEDEYFLPDQRHDCGWWIAVSSSKLVLRSGSEVEKNGGGRLCDFSDFRLSLIETSRNATRDNETVTSFGFEEVLLVLTCIFNLTD